MSKQGSDKAQENLDWVVHVQRALEEIANLEYKGWWAGLSSKDKQQYKRYLTSGGKCRVRWPGPSQAILDCQEALGVGDENQCKYILGMYRGFGIREWF